jgi:hypothetical protein
MPGSDIKDMIYYDNFVKSLVLPDQNLQEIGSEWKGYRIRHQVAPLVNRDLSQLQLNFKLSEDLINYINLYYWMLQVRYGELDQDYDGLFRKYAIKRINVEILDNEKRVNAIIYFTNCFLTSLSSLSLQMGTSDEVEFTVNLSYETCEFQTKNIMGE